MPSNLKKLIRARMEKTGESWQTALRYVRGQAQNKYPKPQQIKNTEAASTEIVEASNEDK